MAHSVPKHGTGDRLIAHRYRVLRELGAGAAGGVCLVEDTHRPGSRLALKRVHESAGDLLRRSFEREFSILASVHVPGVAPVVDFGVFGERARAFFTRAFVDGEPLSTWAAPPQAPEDRAPHTRGLHRRVACFARVCGVIEPLHRQGVVHGDLKPSNIIVADDQPHVIDFGLARLSRFLAKARNRGGSAAGTPAFMSPEMLRGEPASLASDLYALGAILWWLVTGRVPHEGEPDGILRSRLRDGLPQLPHMHSPGLSLLRVAHKTLAPAPEKRLHTVDELLAALELWAQRFEPGSASLRPPIKPFQSPRPRGNERTIDALDRWCRCRLDTEHQSAATGPGCLVGPTGSGKSTVLRQIKWRLQLQGLAVVEVEGVPDEPIIPGAWPWGSARRLLDRLRTWPEVEHPTTAEPPESSVDASPAALFHALQRARRTGPLALLVDDARGVEGSVLENILEAEQQPGEYPLIVIVTAKDVPSIPPGFRHAHRFFMEPLSATTVRPMVRDAVGMVDGDLTDALMARCGPWPGPILGALAKLAPTGAITVSDVKALETRDLCDGPADFSVPEVPPHTEGLLAILAKVPAAIPVALLEDQGWSTTHRVERAQREGWVLHRGGRVTLAHPEHRKAFARWDAGQSSCALCERIMGHPLFESLAPEERALVSLEARDPSAVDRVVQSAEALMKRGELRAAGHMVRRAMTVWDDPHLQTTGSRLDPARLDGDRMTLRLQAAKLCHEQGDYAACVEHARAVWRAGGDPRRGPAEAALLLGRARISLGDYDGAIEVLSAAPGTRGPQAVAAVHAARARELAKAHLRKGEYEEAERVAREGLEGLGADDPLGVELLTTLGMVATYRAERNQAISLYEEALRLADAHGSARDRANARAYLAIEHQRTGDLEGALALLEKSLEIAKGAGDFGSMASHSLNLGTVHTRLGRGAEALEHYENASRLARRANRTGTAVVAQNNLAHLLLHFGLFERARERAQGALQEATEAKMKSAAAQAHALLGESLARVGQRAEAHGHFDAAQALFTELSQPREALEVSLDHIEAHLAPPAAPDETQLRWVERTLDRCTRENEAQGLQLHAHIALCEAQLKVIQGQHEAAIRVLQAMPSLDDDGPHPHRIPAWKRLATLASAHDGVGARFLGDRNARTAMEYLERDYLRLPTTHRRSFWQDPRRRAVSERAAASRSRPAHDHGARSGPPVHEWTGDPLSPDPSEHQSAHRDLQHRFSRLLECIKGLALETRLDRLLGRITESAIELSGAERGCLLLVDDTGNLSPEVVARGHGSDRGQEAQDQAFSRSIAESVLIDGKPIVSIDAMADGRLTEFMSVHKLALRSLACVPVRGRSGTAGVLYLEHRMRRGRFHPVDTELLLALADQAAIALETARLVETLKTRGHELKSKNEELQAARERVERLLHATKEDLSLARLEAERVRDRLHGQYQRHGIIGASAPMRAALAIVDRVAPTAVPVVVQGESGTGKELFARAIHNAGTRAGEPFVAVNCAAIADGLMESELFGHRRGAFTGADRSRKGIFERAHGGTLFLDEVADMPPKMQVELLRVLQEGVITPVGANEPVPVDVRLITACNRPLSSLVSEGKFRQDLYYRLHVVVLSLPPLRERSGDVVLLAQHFLKRFCDGEGTGRKSLAPAAMEKLEASPLPGNVRQLEHALMRAVVLCESDTIHAKDLELTEAAGPLRSARPPPETTTVNRAAEANTTEHQTAEKAAILHALQKHNWNRVKAAQSLSMPRRTFYRRLKRYGILR